MGLRQKQSFYLFLTSLSLALFSSCSNVVFEEKPIAQCNGSTLNCQSVIENGRRVNLYDYHHSVPHPKADILFVVDNSRSMAPEQRLLGSAFSNFSYPLTGIDWRVAITTTDMTPTGMGGRLVTFTGSNLTFINEQTPNFHNLFYNTVSGQGESGSNDERGILSALRVIESSGDGFIRSDSHVAVILLSDEDERSTGGRTQGFEIEPYTPEYYVQRVGSVLGGRSHSFYSIIIRPEDTQCEQQQMSGGYGCSDPSSCFRGYFGTRYFQLQSLITQQLYGRTLSPFDSEVGNICEPSYYHLIETIANSIRVRVEPITLACEPVDGVVELNPDRHYRMEGRQLIIEPSPQPGDTFHLRYRCNAN